MDNTIHLGGNIELSGVEALDSASMVILKKMIGNYARQFSEKINVQKLSVNVSKSDAGHCLNSVLVTDSSTVSAEFVHSNLFIALDGSLKCIDKDCK